MIRLSGRSMLVLALCLLAAAAAAIVLVFTTGSHKSKATVAIGAGNRLAHIFVIVLENHSSAGVIGDKYTPYISSLAREYGYATRYYGVTHPSQPNYIALLAGKTFGINNDDPGNRYSGPNLVDQLEATGHSWAGYMDSMPEAGYLGDYYPAPDKPLYASQHNPFVLFDDIRSSPARLAKVRPYTSLASDLRRAATTPDFALIVPNQCHDMHGAVSFKIADGDGSPCPFGSDNDLNDRLLKQSADGFVHRTVSLIMASPAWRQPSAIFVIADESDVEADQQTTGQSDVAGCCDSPVVVKGAKDVPGWSGGVYGGGLAPAVVVTSHGPRHVVSKTPYNQYSVLATIEQNWNLGYLGYAGDTSGGVVPMDDLTGTK